MGLALLVVCVLPLLLRLDLIINWRRRVQQLSRRLPSFWLHEIARDTADKASMTEADQSAAELGVLLEKLQTKMAKLEGNLQGQVL